MSPPSPSDDRPVLYVVDTPIGNLEDLTRRAIDTFRAVPFVIAEDTRRSKQLLSHLDLRTDVVSFHQHSGEDRLTELVQRIQRERSAALVSDAGNPTISDPGWRLVAEAQEDNVRVVPVPGPSAVSAALSIAGVNADRYVFAGYPPEDHEDREEWFQTAQESEGPMVCFVPPHDVEETLSFFRKRAEGLQIIAGRELTKKHEERLSGTADELIDDLTDREEIKGEWTFVLDTETEGVPAHSSSTDEERIQVKEEDVTFLLELDVSHSTAARILSHFNEIDRGKAYDLLLEKK